MKRTPMKGRTKGSLSKRQRQKMRVDPQAILASDQHDEWSVRLDTARRSQAALATRDDLPLAAVALEAVVTLVGLHLLDQDGTKHDAILETLPAMWRADTVPIPVALLRPILEGWIQYKRAPTGKTFGECLDFEARVGQGSQPVRSQLEGEFRARSYAKEVWEEIFSATLQGTSLSKTAAIALVADRRGVSDKTIARALREHEPFLLERPRDEGWIE